MITESVLAMKHLYLKPCDIESKKSPKGRKVERSKGRKVERSKGRKVERSKHATAEKRYRNTIQDSSDTTGSAAAQYRIYA
jgi:hypothetical protein